MNTTIDLLDKALETTKLSERALSLRIGLSASNLSVARNRGSLSPVAAGQIAKELGQDVAYWMAIAVIESAQRSRVTEHLRRAVEAVHKL